MKIILADTNVVYKLFFFISKGLIPKENINIPGLGLIEFHPVVLEEVEAHTEAWRIKQEMGLDIGDWPDFFDSIGNDEVKKIEDFAQKNISKNTTNISVNTDAFQRKKKAYEVERKRIQTNLVAKNYKGAKSKSIPTDNDYRVLYAAEKDKRPLLTNDEILLAVANAFLDDDQTLKTEDVIKAIFVNDKKTEESIKEVIDTLGSLNESFNSARVFTE